MLYPKAQIHCTLSGSGRGTKIDHFPPLGLHRN